jgi:hypothetical protein
MLHFKNIEKMDEKIVNKFMLLAALCGFVGISVISVYKCLEPIVYEGFVQNIDTDEYISGAKITFLEYPPLAQTSSLCVA